MKKQTYAIKAKVFVWQGMKADGTGPTSAWHFVALPKKQSEELKKKHGAHAKGWGSLPVSVTIGETTWNTSIFPDSKSGTYLLPLKADVRRKEEVQNEDIVRVRLVL